MKWLWENLDVGFFLGTFFLGGILIGFATGVALNPSLPRVEKFERVEILGHRFECREEKP